MVAFLTVIFLLTLDSAAGTAPRWVSFAEKLQSLKDDSLPFIIGGEIVQGREFPGQVSVQRGRSHICGGSIINTHYILTAAHCSQREPSEITILSGTNALNNSGTRHNVVEIKVHEEYDPFKSWHNDIAVIKVDPPFVFDETTAPVILPALGQNTPAGSKATVIGWGVTIAPRVNDLRKVGVDIWDHEVCKRIYNDIYYNVFPEQICADTPEGGKGSCSGDSGGPLFVNGNVIGLVSWASGCANKDFPSVFTEVSDYIDWIETQTRN